MIRPEKNHIFIGQVESGKLVLEETEFDLARELEGLVDMFSVQCINHNVETVLDLSGTSLFSLQIDFETLHIVF